MNAAQIHLITVHVPIVGCWGLSILFVLARLLRDDRLFEICCWLLLTILLLATVAYFSGPPAYELLQAHYNVEKEIVEFHAILARSCLLAMVVLSMIVGNALIQRFQGETIPRWQRSLIVVGTISMAVFWTIAAHWGGMIRHPEIRFSGSNQVEAVTPENPQTGN
ncbi:hypothetical protein [Gimesia fumaroli]|uniref:DUF2231 domain-containing protein n=1 Tax=Gimesia fumaroli TaxID=2527976 RepID=A0A518IFP0_9PLAN|nr:hypothetical protein [Gimesia fumaroli]QDV51896.1 hypothetical protein Enr17x_39550 [Gimesia fumaroli]